MTLKDNQTVGLTDSPATSDELGISKYISGLSNFILHCSTPMTIAIQGEWGTGKTTIIRQVISQLESQNTDENKNKIIEINTWQYSQFNTSDNISVIFTMALLEKLKAAAQEDDSTSEKFSKATKAIKNLFRVGSQVVLGYLSNGAYISPNEGDNDSDRNNEGLPNYTSILSDLPNLIKEAINACIKDDNERIVFFVDDLDRLDPEHAVELLSVIKMFLMTEHCVFVLAVDEKVIQLGLKQKYDSYDELADDATYSRHFFEKLIQVPFKVPLSAYEQNISAYIKNEIESSLGITIEDGDKDKYARLAQYTVGNNPRALKRIINIFSLLRLVEESTGSADDFSRSSKILFVVVCLRYFRDSHDNDLLNYIRMKLSDEESEITFIEDDENSFARDVLAIPPNTEITPDDANSIEEINSFVSIMKTMLVEESETEISEETIETLKKFIDLSDNTTTHTTQLDEVARRIQKQVLQIAEEEFIDKGIYQYIKMTTDKHNNQIVHYIFSKAPHDNMKLISITPTNERGKLAISWDDFGKELAQKNTQYTIKDNLINDSNLRVANSIFAVLAISVAEEIKH